MDRSGSVPSREEVKILSLFSGVGGLDLAVETLLGVETAIMCERDEYARRVLSRHWPGVPIVEDVTWVGDVGADVICGGPPCQDVSVAGKQAAEKGTRWLWPEAVRVTAANRPRLCLWENVPGLLTADGGRAFAGLLRAFDAIGYATRWDHCEAAAAGAPHRRDRVFLICVPVDRFRQPGPVQGRPISMFGHADEPTWPRAGWYSGGRWGVERARFPKGRIAVKNWATPKANDKNASDTMPQDVRDYREARGCLDAVAQAVAKAWPTPQAHDEKGKPGVDSLAYAGLASSLPATVEIAAWPTPCAEDPKHPSNGLARCVGSLWPTPVLNDGTKEGTGTLAREVQCGGSHTRRDGGERSTPPTGSTGNSAATTGALNPEFSEWLQGFAPGWTEPGGPALPHVAHGHQDVPLTYYGGRPAPAGMALLTTVKVNRRNRLKCLGNAVFARCAFLALRALVDGQPLSEVE